MHQKLKRLWEGIAPGLKEAGVRVLPCGDAALTIEFGNIVDASVSARVLDLDARLAAAHVTGVIEAVPTYRSLLVHYDPEATDFATLSANLLALVPSRTSANHHGTTWRIPVVYGADFGIDLEDVAAHHQITTAEIIARHAKPIYRIYMIGFLPGFTYLGGLDPALAMPRRQVPRTKAPAGLIAIGGAQACIGSIEGPSGWHILGRTPVRAFMPQRDPAVFMAPGDRVFLDPIPREKFEALDAAAERGALVAERSS